MKRIFIILIKLLGTTLAVALLFRLVDIDAVLPAIQRISVGHLLAGFMLYGFCQVFAALRWRFVLSQHGLPVTLTETLRVNTIGVFASMFMPGVAGGDIFRPMLLRERRSLSRSTLYASVIFERLVGIIATVIWAAIGLAILPSDTIGPAIRIPLILLAIGVPLLFVVFGFAGRILAQLPRVPEKISGIADRFSLFFRESAENPRLLVVTLFYSLCFQLSMICAYAAFLFGMTDLETPFAIVLAPPIAWLASMIPVSFNGLGVREMTLVYILKASGVDGGAAAAAAIIAVVPIFIVALLGALLFSSHLAVTKDTVR